MYFSFLGDSITTYHGQNPWLYKVWYRYFYARRAGVKKVADTWWRIVADHFGAKVLKNDSFAASTVSVRLDITAVIPAGITDERVRNLATKRNVPDVIIIYFGVNDMNFSHPLTNSDGNRKAEEVFDSAYEIMLGKIKERYPGAKIVASTIMKGYIKNNPAYEWDNHFGDRDPIEAYNSVIRKTCEKCGVICIDPAARNVRYSAVDGLHPDGEGHRTMAKLIIEELEKVLV